MPDGRKYGPVIAKNQNYQNFILLSCFVQLSFEPPFKVWEYVKELGAACVPLLKFPTDSPDTFSFPATIPFFPAIAH